LGTRSRGTRKKKLTCQSYSLNEERLENVGTDTGQEGTLSGFEFAGATGGREKKI